jgi:hypothetical protein
LGELITISKRIFQLFISKRKLFFCYISTVLVFLMVSACSSNFTLTDTPQKQITELIQTTTILPSPTPTKTPSPTSTSTSIPTNTATIEPTEPAGCLKPNDDYGLITINGVLLNQRTYLMLEHAQFLYDGELEITGYHITQGSYTDAVLASFSTHAGGGAVDLSVIQYGTYQVLYDEIEPLIKALRTAGFAAWLRDFDQLYPGSPIHIHAIAIGDRDLSGDAQDQLTGDFGYFYGYNGLPQPKGSPPVPDEHSGPIICKWMLEMGYPDVRTPTP